MKLTQTFIAIALIGVSWAVDGASAEPTPADYEHAIGLREKWMYLTENVVEPAAWIENTHRFYYRKTVKGGFRYVMADAATGDKKPAFDHARLGAALGKASGETYDPLRLPFAVRPFSSFRFVDGDAGIEATFDDADFSCTLADYRCEKLPEEEGRPRGFDVVRDLQIPADNRAKKSPDGKWETLVEGDNVVLRPAGGGTVTRLSADGTADNFYDPETLVWSTDSKKIAVYRVRPGFRREVHRVETSPEDRVQPRLLTQLYPKPGDAVDVEQPVIFHVNGARRIEVSNELFPRPYQLTELSWRADGKTVSFEYVERGHQLNRLIEIDAESGKARAPITEKSETFVNRYRRFRHDVNNGGDEVIWMSERDGWNHLYLYDGKSGEVKNRITSGDWVVREVIRVDDDERRIWFAASGMYPDSDPYFQHYYRINFDGGGLTALTTADAWHDVSFSTDMEYYVDTWSRADTAPVSELRRASDGSLVREIERGDISRLLAAGFEPPEVFVAKGRDGKTDIWGIIVRPTNFDPARKYPVIENIYAGPHSSFTPKSFWPFGAHSSGDKVIGMQALAEMGFIVVQMDGMGTMNRSKAFHDVAWKNLGDAGFPDRILWHKAAAKKYPYYDTSRVGIYGGSAGGQNSLGGLLFHPDFYKVAVSYVGCHDNRMDKISWNEQWMGYPVDESYARASNVDNAWRLEGHVLLVLGELDMNVDPASTMQVVDALIEAGKMFDLLVYPGGGHGVGRTVGSLDYAARRQYDYFIRHLRGEETPRWNMKTRSGS